MKTEKRKEQILNELWGKPAPRKHNLAKRIGLSISRLNQYLAQLRKEGKIAYLRSRDARRPNSTYVVLKR